MLTRTFFARAPLAPGRFAPLPVGAVSAQGATRDRLLALRGGLLSRCASVFPEAGEQSVWFGGPLGGGMHAPELLEAMLLTGAQLGDEELRREALRLCGRVVERQREDGSFGAPGETFAARGRMLRALCAAYSMSGDKQFLTFMLRYMKYLHDTLRVCALSAEDAMHTADTLEAGVLLYNVTGQKAILSVLMMLVSQGADYTSLYHAFPYRTPISRSFSADELLDALDHEDESGYTHHLLRTADGANLCEGLRASALCGVLTGTDVFSALTDGARDGLKTVMRIFPALVALLTAVSMLRASGALEALTRLCAPILARLGIPPETAILLLVRPISGSGALAAASDIIQTYGADSRIGRTAAVMLGSTETTFYVLAVYFGACGIRHSRWAVPAAIVADVTGFVTAAALVRCLWGT